MYSSTAEYDISTTPATSSSPTADWSMSADAGEATRTLLCTLTDPGRARRDHPSVSPGAQAREARHE